MSRKVLLGLVLLGFWAGAAGAQEVQSRELGEPGQPAPRQQEAPAQETAPPPAQERAQSSGQRESAPPPAPKERQEDTGGPHKPVAAFWFVLPER